MSKISFLTFGAKAIDYKGLRRLNVIAALAYGVQAILILFLRNAHNGSATINSSFLGQDKIASQAAGQSVYVQATHHLFDLNLAYVVAAFLLMGTITNLLIATRYRKTYETSLGKKTNRARWIEYGLVAGIMMLAIALLIGVFELSLLLLVFSGTLLMALLGFVTEARARPASKINWFSYWIALASGVVPWIVVLIYLWSSYVYGNGVPAFVYWVIISLLALFACLAINRGFQHKKLGRWDNFLFGERTYIVLMFVAQTALAWQIFFGTLH